MASSLNDEKFYQYRGLIQKKYEKNYVTTKHDSTLQTNAYFYIWVTQQTVKISNISKSV